jgi:NAD(P)-dependent dehydrogenase (short-subunit alcohol dehydrogenase family)
MKLKDKVAVMTASGSGIGREIAMAFAREGAAVVVNDINAEAGEQVRETIEQDGGNAIFFEADVSDATKVEQIVDLAVSRFGRLDILLNNAAYLDFRGMRPLTEVPIEVWDRAVAVGLRSYFLGCKFAIPAMISGGGGVIINTASVGGLEGAHWYCHYNAVKAAVINLTRNVALDYARQNIRCVSICPGSVITGAVPDAGHPLRKLRENMIPAGRFGTTQDIASLALFLVGDEASFINGVAIPVDGGMVAGKFIHDFADIMGNVAKRQRA